MTTVRNAYAYMPLDHSSPDAGPKTRSWSQALRHLLCFEMLRVRNVVLALLLLQTTSIVLLMHHSRTRVWPEEAGPMYLSSVAVFLAEASKLPICLVMTAWTTGGLGGCVEALRVDVIGKPVETLKCLVPAVTYMIQNNLLFVALGNLDPPTYQVLYQTKTLFTALFSRWMFRRQLKPSQWWALVLLFLGTVLVSDLHKKRRPAAAASTSLGLAAVLVAAVLSAGSGVYVESILKRGVSSAEAASLWLRNVQLGIFAVPLALLPVLTKDFEQVRAYGMMQGVDGTVWLVVLLNSLGGLLVAATMKFADNIVKCFAAGLAIVISTLLSVPLFDFKLRPIFAVGSSVTVVATVLYSMAPDCRRPEQSQLDTETINSDEPLLHNAEAEKR